MEAGLCVETDMLLATCIFVLFSPINFHVMLASLSPEGRLGSSDVSPAGGGVFWCPPPPPPPCLESRGCQFDSTFLYHLSCSSALSFRSLCLILVCFWLILLTFFSLILHFLKGRLFCVALVVFLSS